MEFICMVLNFSPKQTHLEELNDKIWYWWITYRAENSNNLFPTWAEKSANYQANEVYFGSWTFSFPFMPRRHASPLKFVCQVTHTALLTPPARPPNQRAATPKAWILAPEIPALCPLPAHTKQNPGGQAATGLWCITAGSLGFITRR